MAFTAIGLEADHAYWLSGLTLRDGGGTNPLGTIEVRSEGFGTSDPTASGTMVDGGVLTGGLLPALSYERQRKEWGPTPSTPVADRLDIRATNISAVTIDAARARVSCSASLAVQSDGPLDVRLTGCGGGAEGVTTGSSLPDTGVAPPAEPPVVPVLLAVIALLLLKAAHPGRRHAPS